MSAIENIDVRSTFVGSKQKIAEKRFKPIIIPQNIRTKKLDGVNGLLSTPPRNDNVLSADIDRRPSPNLLLVLRRVPCRHEDDKLCSKHKKLLLSGQELQKKPFQKK